MKKYVTTLILAFACLAGNGQIIFQDNFDANSSCDNSTPAAWTFWGNVVVTDSCSGYALPHGAQNPASNYHYLSLITYDRDIPNHRQYAGSLLPDESAIFPGDEIYVEVAINHGEHCIWSNNGFGFYFSGDAFSVVDTFCEVSHIAQVQMATIFHTDSSWTLFGGYFTATDTLISFAIGNFNCDDGTALSMDTLQTQNNSITNVDDVTITRIMTSVRDGIFNEANYIKSTDMLGIPCERSGLRIEWYTGGMYRKVFSY